MGGPNAGGGKGKGGKGGKKGKPDNVGGSFLKQQFRARAPKKPANNEVDLGTVGMSKENQSLVLDVLHNIKNDIDEEVKGLGIQQQKRLIFIDGAEARDVTSVVSKGIPEDIVREVAKRMPGSSFEERLWAAVRAAMEQVAEEEGGTFEEGGDDPETMKEMAKDEYSSLECVMGEALSVEGDKLQVTLDLQNVPQGYDDFLKDLRIVFPTFFAGGYPGATPLALVESGTLGCPPAKEELNRVLWRKLVCELAGQEAVFEASGAIEECAVEIAQKHIGQKVEKKLEEERLKAEEEQQKRGKGGKGYKGARGKCFRCGGTGHTAHNCPGLRGPQAAKEAAEAAKAAPVTKAGLLEELMVGGKDQPVPQLFPELDLTTIRSASASNAADMKRREGASIEKNAELDAKLKDEFCRRRAKGEGLPEVRAKLPAAKYESEIVKLVSENQVVLVSGETGCGKTTQVPQFILDAMLESGRGSECNIVCTQPRRIAATSIAQRVAQERGQRLGDQIGYSIRLESRLSKDTRLMFCTTGIILRKLQIDHDLSTISHIIVDEVHERSLDSDFLLIFLRELLPRRPNLKVILMSATINADLFSDYFGGCPVITIPGFTHPVEMFHLEDVIDMVGYRLEEDSPYCLAGSHQSYLNVDDRNQTKQSDVSTGLRQMQAKDAKAAQELEVLRKRFPNASNKALDVVLRMDPNKINNELIVELIQHIVCSDEYRGVDGAILVFLPGMGEINALYDEIRSYRRLQGMMEVLRLHSTVSNQEQLAVFKSPPRGMRKVVLSTNIAETSVTIDDIVFVIDTGKHKENRYDTNRSMVKLVQCWISQANAKQRRGRAGRVRPGKCFRLYTSHTHDKTMRSFQDCEMSRVPLDNLLLQIRVMDFGLGPEMRDIDVLRRALEKPEDSAIASSQKSLQKIGALGPSNKLTSLGVHLANLPVDPRLGKLLLHGVLLRCLDPCLTIAAALQGKSPFVTPFECKMQADQTRLAMSQGCRSDHLTINNAYVSWLVTLDEAKGSRRAEAEFTKKNFLSVPALQQLQQTKQQYFTLLCDQRLVEAEGAKRWSTTDSTGERHIFEFGGKELNMHSTKHQAIRACLTAAFTPNVVKVKQKPGAKRPFFNEQKMDVQVHPSSVCSDETNFPHPLLVYLEKVQTTQVYVRDVTMVSPQTLMLFAVDVVQRESGVLINDWLSFNMEGKMLAVVAELRRELQKMISQKIEDPTMALSAKHTNVVAAVMKLLTDERVAQK